MSNILRKSSDFSVESTILKFIGLTHHDNRIHIQLHLINAKYFLNLGFADYRTTSNQRLHSNIMFYFNATEWQPFFPV